MQRARRPGVDLYLCVSIHTHKHTFHSHQHPHAHSHSSSHTHAHTHAHKDTHVQAGVVRHAVVYLYTHPPAHPPTHASTHQHVHAHTLSCSHKHTEQSPSNRPFPPSFSPPFPICSPLHNVHMPDGETGVKALEPQVSLDGRLVNANFGLMIQQERRTRVLYDKRAPPTLSPPGHTHTRHMKHRYRVYSKRPISSVL